MKLCEYGERLETMTAREVFDVAKEHLLTQGKRCGDEDGCLYQGEGICCAAAPFLLKYDSTIEGLDWDNVVAEGYASDRHAWLISQLQHIHDELEDWPERLDTLEPYATIEWPDGDEWRDEFEPYRHLMFESGGRWYMRPIW